MCEAVERYANKVEKRAALNAEVNLILSIMDKNDFSLNQALDFSGVEGEERSLITEEVKKRQKAIS